MLRAKEADVEYLSAYLHDSMLYASDITWSKEDGILRIQLTRQCHEKSQHSHWLFVIPVIRYPAVTSRLIVHNVQTLDEQWTGKATQSDTYCHNLIEIEYENGQLFLVTDGLKLTATLSSFQPIELEDLSSPTDRLKFTDLFSSVSGYNNWRNAIERMKVDV